MFNQGANGVPNNKVAFLNVRGRFGRDTNDMVTFAVHGTALHASHSNDLDVFERAKAMPFRQFTEFPEVEYTNSTSPALPSAWIWRENNSS